MMNAISIRILLLATLLSPAAPFAAETSGTAPVRPMERPRGVTAAPNETVVVGTVEQQCALLASALGMKPEMTVFRVRIAVTQVERGTPLRGQSRHLSVLSKQEIPLLVGAKVRATIRYRGDERGGSYWLGNIEKSN